MATSSPLPGLRLTRAIGVRIPSERPRVSVPASRTSACEGAGYSRWNDCEDRVRSLMMLGCGLVAAGVTHGMTGFVPFGATCPHVPVRRRRRTQSTVSPMRVSSSGTSARFDLVRYGAGGCSMSEFGGNPLSMESIPPSATRALGV